MNLANVMDQVAAQLDTIADLRCFGYPPDSVSPPAAWPTYPEDYTYDETYGRGMDRMTLGVMVVVGKITDRSSRDELAAYVNGSGAKSVKAVLEAGTYTALHTLRVASAEFDVVRIAATDYIAARFDLDIAGPGS